MPPIHLIALDLDGTLLDSRGRLSARNAQAIRRAGEAGVQVVLATGKSRGSAEALLRELDLRTPGVFSQGLLICDADGAVRHETTLEPEVARAVIRFAEARGLPHFAYAGMRLLTPAHTPQRTLLHRRYHEPEPEIVGSLLDGLAARRINKLLVSDEAHNERTRAALAALVGERASVTQAVPTFIEVLPPGASKGAGVRWLLAALGVDPRHVLAVGDGENDIELIKMASVGVAVGNAHPALKAVADAIVASNDESGVAEAIERFVLT